MTIGRIRTTTPSMTARVSELDDASHTVRLAFGSLDDGSRKGNSAAPAVAMVPAGTSAEHSIAFPGKRRSNPACTPSPEADNGGGSLVGCPVSFANQPLGRGATVDRS